MSAHTAAKATHMRRWTSVLLRAAHLVAVIGLAGTVLLDAGSTGHDWALAVLISGATLFVNDYWGRPDRLLEVSAASIAAKLLLVAALALLPQWQVALFWAVVIWSVIFAHAPASFRHARIGPSRARR